MGAQDYTVTSHLNGNRAPSWPSSAAWSECRPGGRRVKNLLAEQKRRLPQGIDYAVTLDTTRAVSEGIKEIIVTLLIAILLVIVVVYVFLQGWRATLILLAVPCPSSGRLFSFGVRLFRQHAVAVRTGVGDRASGGRCDRRRRGG